MQTETYTGMHSWLFRGLPKGLSKMGVTISLRAEVEMPVLFVYLRWLCRAFFVGSYILAKHSKKNEHCLLHWIKQRFAAHIVHSC